MQVHYFTQQLALPSPQTAAPVAKYIIMIKHLVSVLAFMLVTFGVQGLSHFVINKDHFAGISFARPDPILPLGFLAMIIQGIILSVTLVAWREADVRVIDGVLVSATFGLFLASYIAFAEPAKYAAPSVPAWVLIEGTASIVQFAIFGVLLGIIHTQLG